MSSDELTMEVARLKRRVDSLEQCAHSAPDGYVEGWEDAARFVGVNAKTIKARLERGEFPKPCRIDTIPRAKGEAHERPTWRRADLVAYAEGKWDPKKA